MKSANAEARLTAIPTRRAGTKVGISDPAVPVTEAPKGAFSLDGNQMKSVNAEARLTAIPTRRAGTKVGISDPAVPNGRAVAQRIKATLGITG